MNMLRRWTERKTNGGGIQRRQELDEEGGMERLFRPMMNLQSQINEVFEDFFEDFPMRSEGPMEVAKKLRRFQPRVDVSESADAIMITADVPGMVEDDIDITLSDDTLTISGERSESREKEDEDYFHRERSYGMFSRRIPLPTYIERDEISAKFKNGVLKIEVPKSEEGRKHWRKIEVKSG